LVRTYRELLVWRKAKHLAMLAYRETKEFPKSELFGLTSQIRRSAISIPSNIAEGQGRLTKGDSVTSWASILELETQIAIAYELGYLQEAGYRMLESQTFQVLGLLNRLLESLSRPTLKPSKP
jgi:four helix bundle protein